MAHYIDADGLRAEINRLIADPTLGSTTERKIGGHTALLKLVSFLDSLQQEWPSLPDELKKAAGEYAVDNAQYYYEDDDNAICSTADILKPAFIAGAEWMAQQGVKAKEEDK